MPLSLAEHNIRNMSDQELMLVVIQTYADKSNWEPYEKDYGAGRPIMRTPWSTRDKGSYAQQAVEILKQRGVIQ